MMDSTDYRDGGGYVAAGESASGKKGGRRETSENGSRVSHSAGILVIYGSALLKN